MPMYDFSCQECGEAFEDLLSDTTLAPPCPKCASRNTMRMLSAPSPLKKGAFPFPCKPGLTQPLAARMGGGGGCASGMCPHTACPGKG